MSATDAEHLIDELARHKLELEAQNDELREAQETLESARREYADLYDFAPVGYFTINADSGTISKTNDAGARMLGYPKRWLLNKPFGVFVDRDDRDTYAAYRHEALMSLGPSRCFIRLRRRKAPSFPAALYSSSVSRATDEQPVFVRMAVIDFSEQRVFDRQNELWQALQEALQKIKVLSSLVPVCERCHRVRDDEAYRQRLNEYLAGSVQEAPEHNLCPVCEAGQNQPPVARAGPQ